MSYSVYSLLVARLMLCLTRKRGSPQARIRMKPGVPVPPGGCNAFSESLRLKQALSPRDLGLWQGHSADARCNRFTGVRSDMVLLWHFWMNLGLEPLSRFLGVRSYDGEGDLA